MQAICFDHLIFIDFLIITLFKENSGHADNTERKRILNSTSVAIGVSKYFATEHLKHEILQKQLSVTK